MIRYVLMLETMNENVFHSSHFAWCNLCIERMNGAMTGPYWNDVWDEFRQKFSTCWIDYQSQALIRDLNTYFLWGRCGMCSGFFTGNEYYMRQVCTRLLATFEHLA